MRRVLLLLLTKQPLLWLSLNILVRQQTTTNTAIREDLCSHSSSRGVATHMVRTIRGMQVPPDTTCTCFCLSRLFTERTS